MAQDENQDRDYPHQAITTNGEQTSSAAEESSHPSNGDQRKTSSAAKIASSRENGKRSNGPTSSEGKAKSSRNSYKHGFFARQPLPPGEAGAALWGAYQDLVAGIWEYYKPVGYLEGLLTEKIATESIRFSRLLTFESNLVDGINLFSWNGLDRLLRYQGTINRQLFQAMRELERMQERRKAQAMSTNGSSSSLGYPGTGTPLLDEDSTHSPEEGEGSIEGSESGANIVPPMSHWELIPLIIDPRKGQRKQNLPPPSTAANYGTNPTVASSKQSGSIAPSNPPKRPKESLAERATKALDLPPMEGPANMTSKGPEQGRRVDEQGSEEEIPYRTKFIAPGDEPLFREVQESIRREENERLDKPHDPEDPEDSS
jgi:hypothetical protein